MPRALNRAGDESTTPICGQCLKSGRYCARPQQASNRFLAYSHPSSSGAGRGTASRTTRCPYPENPREALELVDVASYFHNYICEPAKWYDLNDASRQFATAVPEKALDEPLLFSAIVALSAIHVNQTTGSKVAGEVAEFYHGHCVRLLIQLDEKSELLRSGVALATACLLRSYEILAEDVDPNRHLQGAHSLASCEGLIADSLPGSLLAAGFWNYLREDITFSLFEGCPLKMDLAVATAPKLTDEDQLHSISLILGQIINATFGRQVSEAEWTKLAAMIQQWLDDLPPQVKPYSSCRAVTSSLAGELPRRWFLQDFHASAMHYLLVSSTILAVFATPEQLRTLPQPDNVNGELTRAELLEAYALEICGIAFTANIPSVIVNTFGPIAYCGKFIRAEPARQEVIRRLYACKKAVGWPVERLIASLKSSWTASEGESTEPSHSPTSRS